MSQVRAPRGVRAGGVPGDKHRLLLIGVHRLAFSGNFKTSEAPKEPRGMALVERTEARI